jgi:hypothetical protein
MSEIKILNLFQRINEVRKKVEYIKKEKAVQNYKTVTHDQVTALIRDDLIKQGIVIFPVLISSITADTGEKTSNGTPIIRVEQEYEFVVVNEDDPLDRLVGKVSAHANDTGDKAPGKALSYAKKSFVLKLFEIETGADDESRYQTSDVDTEFYIDMIKSAETMDILKKVFAEGFGVANTAKDKDAAKLILNAKDKRKAELSK